MVVGMSSIWKDADEDLQIHRVSPEPAGQSVECALTETGSEASATLSRRCIRQKRGPSQDTAVKQAAN